MLYIFKSCIKKDKIYNKEKSEKAKQKALIKGLLLESELKFEQQQNNKSKNVK